MPINSVSVKSTVLSEHVTPLQGTAPSLSNTSVAANLVKAVNNAHQNHLSKTQSATSSPVSPEDTKTFGLSKPSALALGVAGTLSLAGAPIVAGAVTYGLATLLAIKLCQHVLGEEAKAKEQNEAAQENEIELANETLGAVMGVFTEREQEILIRRLVEHWDNLNPTELIRNLHRALENKSPFESIEDVLKKLPVKDWIKAAEHEKKRVQAELDAEQTRELKALKKQEFWSAIESFFSLLTHQTDRVVAGSSRLARLNGDQSDIQRGLAQYEAEAAPEQILEARNVTADWAIGQIKASEQKNLADLAIQVAHANVARDRASQASPETKAELRAIHHQLKNQYTIAKLKHEAKFAADKPTAIELQRKLVEAQSKVSKSELAHKDRKQYFAAYDPDIARQQGVPTTDSATPQAAPKVSSQEAGVPGVATAQSPLVKAMEQAGITTLGFGIGAAIGQPIVGAMLGFAMSRPANAATTQNWTPPLMPGTVDDTPVVLNNHTQASEQALLNSIAEQWNQYKGDLEVSEQRQLLESIHKDLEVQIKVGKQVEEHDKTSRFVLKNQLAEALTKKFGRAINPDEVYLKTRFPGTKHELPKFQKRSLYEAARTNFDWREVNPDPTAINSDNTIIVDASDNNLYISIDQMKTAIRDFNLGARRANQFEQVPIKSLIQQASSAQWLRDCLDFKRRTSDLPPALLTADKSVYWTSYSLGLDSSAAHQSPDTKLALPLMIFSSEGKTYSYSPGRPGGALQVHDSEQAAVTAFNQKIIDDGKAGKLDWLYRGMSIKDQIKLETFLETEDSLKVDDASKFDHDLVRFWTNNIANPIARFLREMSASTPIPKADQLRVIPDTQLENRPFDMQKGIATKVMQRLRSDWSDGMRSTDEANVQGWKAFATAAFMEIMELLTLPLAPIGMNWLMTAAMAASLGVKIVEGSIEWSKGKRDDAVQALADVIDLAINWGLHGVASRAGDQRTRNMIDHMQKPEAGLDNKVLTVILANQQLGSYVTAQDVQLNGTPDRYGVFHQDARALVQIEHEDRLKTAEVKYDPQISAYRLSGGPDYVYQPPVRYDESLNRCVIDTSLDTRDYSDVELLKWMLPISDASTPLSSAALKQVLDQTGTTRAQLIDAWKGKKIDPANILDAVADLQLKNDIISASKTANTRGAVPTVGEERVILPVLAEEARLSLYIRNPDGSLYASYTPEGQLASLDTIDLIRYAGEYRSTDDSHATDVPNADSLWREVLKAHEKITGHSQLGVNYRDSSFDGRLAELKSQVGERIAADQHILHDTLGSEKIRADLPPDSPACRYAPTGAAHLQASDNVKTLRRLYPELSLNTAKLLLERHGPVDIARRPSQESLPAALRQACAAHTSAIHMDTALASLASPTVQPLNKNAEALLCIAITGHKNADFRIHIADDQGGNGITYGAARHSDVINIIRYQDGKYIAVRDGNEIGPYADSNPLISALLRAMSTAQRDALGVKENSAQRLADWTIAFYKNPQRRGAGANALLEQRTPHLDREVVASYKANIRLNGLKPDARGVYLHSNGKSYIAIDKTPVQIKADSFYMRDGKPVIRMVMPKTRHAELPGETYNPALGYGLPVTHLGNGKWAMEPVGLLGGGKVRTDANLILQWVYTAPRQAVQAILDQYDFPTDASSMHTELNFALSVERDNAVPAWAEQYRRPPVPVGFIRMPDGQLIATADLLPQLAPSQQQPLPSAMDIDLPIDPARNSPAELPQASVGSPAGSEHSSLTSSSRSSSRSSIRMDDEVNLVRENSHAQNLILPAGSYLNTRGYIERKGAAGEYVYRAVAEEACDRFGEPLKYGLKESINFAAVGKMLDGDVIITSATAQGARSYADAEFGSAYRLFKINVEGLRIVSLRENVASNPDFMDERQNNPPGTIAQLRATDQLMGYAEMAYEMNEVHLDNTDVTARRIEEIFKN